jgi:hypothetical protein
MELLFLLLIFVVPIALIASRISSARRRAEEAERRRAEAARARDDEGLGPDPSLGMSPFGMFPFGGLFDHLLMQPGGWSRSYVDDEETGAPGQLPRRPRPER